MDFVTWLIAVVVIISASLIFSYLYGTGKLKRKKSYEYTPIEEYFEEPENIVEKIVNNVKKLTRTLRKTTQDITDKIGKMSKKKEDPLKLE